MGRNIHYQELSMLCQVDGEKSNAQYQETIKQKNQIINTLINKVIKEMDQLINKLTNEVIKEKDQLIKKLTDQLAWYRRKFWKPLSEKYIPADPDQRKIDFEGIETLPQEQEAIKAAEQEIITYNRKKRNMQRNIPSDCHSRSISAGKQKL